MAPKKDPSSRQTSAGSALFDQGSESVRTIVPARTGSSGEDSQRARKETLQGQRKRRSAASARLSHDQRYKNLILDYPLEALKFFAASEAADFDEDVMITPLRQEQLKHRLSDRFWELDVPLEVRWPDGRHEALLFVLEEESEPSRFSIHRLASYCLSLAELMKTDAVVPVVVFLKGKTRGGQPIRRVLKLGSRRKSYLRFEYIQCVLPMLRAKTFWNSTNIVARLNLPNMHWDSGQRVEVYAQAMMGIRDLETDVEKQLKYVRFVDGYLPLDEDEQRRYRDQYVKEDEFMAGMFARTLAEGRQMGIQQGLQEGLQQGRVGMLARLMTRRFGVLDEGVLARLRNASPEELERWADRMLDARTLDELFGVR